jgi:hypothetical protein
MVTVARISGMVGATIWVLGLPVVVIYSTPFSSDASYFTFGVVIALLGLATTPTVLAYPASSSARRTRLVRGLGLVACAALVATGALLVAGSIGLLGDTAPSWVSDNTVIAVAGFFVWILLASYSTRRSAMLGRLVFWLGLVAGASILAPTVISALLFFVDPGFIVTNATIPLLMISSLLTWLALPIWLIALTVRMRPVGGHRNEKGPGREVEVTT